MNKKQRLDISIDLVENRPSSQNKTTSNEISCTTSTSNVITTCKNDRGLITLGKPICEKSTSIEYPEESIKLSRNRRQKVQLDFS